MNEINTNTNSTPESIAAPSRKIPWVSIALGTGLAVSLGVGIMEHMNLVNARMETAALQREMSALRQSLSSTDATVNQTIDSLKAEIASTKKETATSTQAARESARRQAEAIARGLTEKITATEQKQSKELADRMAQVQTSSEQTTAKLSDITTEVSHVKTDLTATRTDLDRTIADLKRTTGDMGVMSGLIATNGKELAALREVGERDYFEFTIARNAGSQHVGDVQVQLKKTDLKKNRFTLEIVADDKRVEKKDRTINEPVQFYVVSKARQPYELVVNEVKKDVIVGYLATPKVKTPGRRL